jgi:oxygen-independent coproporphyrinogen-3 oxidase
MDKRQAGQHRRLETDLQPPPLSLYIHFPWCISKCPYCDFNSHTLKGELSEHKYIDTLIADLDSDLDAETGNRRLVSIFLGGGTPSLFSASSLKVLLQRIQRRLEFSAEVEVTLEANPGTLEHDKFEGYLDAGVNRLSLGIQSFDDEQLKKLGRIHDSSSAENAIHAARVAGFSNFNLDLMHGLPGQSPEMAILDCTRAISHSPAHLSFYQLTIEPNTYFHQFPPQLPDHDQQFEIQEILQNLLNQSGYRQYEVSAYARPSMECRHNLNYWQFGDYIGIGAGAHSKITTERGVIRGWKLKHPESYMNHVQSGTVYKVENKVPEEEIFFEFMMNALRLKSGISASIFQQRTSLTVDFARSTLAGAIDQGWLEITDQKIRCTDTGYLFIDEILQGLLPHTG